MITKEEAKNLAAKEDLKSFATKKEDTKNLATKDGIQALGRYFRRNLEELKAGIVALGAKQGIKNEEGFRQAIIKLLKETSFEAKREILYNGRGYVFNEPSDVEIDVIIKDGKVIIVEITATLEIQTSQLGRKSFTRKE